jgi:hypothetical protein
MFKEFNIEALVEASDMEKKIADKVINAFKGMSKDEQAKFMKSYLKNPDAAVGYMFSNMQKMAMKEEKELDPVNPKALKGKFKDREDKDIDNDGDTDSSDEYLHKRRSAVSKAIGKMKEAVELDEAAYMSGSSTDRAEAHHDQAQKHFDAAENAHSTSEASAHRYAARAHVKAGMSHEKRAENPASKTATAVAAVSSHAHKLTQMAGRIDESVELDELSAVTLGKYSQKARTDALDHSGGPWGKKKDPARVAKRLSGDAMAVKKLDKIRKEEVELDEISRDLARSYIRKAASTGNRKKGVEMAGKKAYSIGGEPKVRATEAKDNYTINHKTFSSAVQHAEEVVNKRGFEVDPEEWDRKVSMGPRKPGAGKTNSYTIAL